ncbi:MAG: NADH-quinone oxidoreductase subunit C [Candidatus Omnitrophica bacterium]|nr:NADH-quinone oxidoreductase subunit C [Candidatus Omnitrophota bacterium]
MDTAAIIQSIKDRFPGAVAEQTPGWVTINKENLIDVARFLKDGPSEFSSLHCLTAVDRKETVEVVYHFYSFKQRIMLTVKVILPNADLVIDSLTPLWGAADWLEREVYDLFGVRFQNHHDLRRIMNPDSWTDHPLRKDFKMAGFIPRPVK